MGKKKENFRIFCSGVNDRISRLFSSADAENASAEVVKIPVSVGDSL